MLGCYAFWLDDDTAKYEPESEASSLSSMSACSDWSVDMRAIGACDSSISALPVAIECVISFESLSLGSSDGDEARDWPSRAVHTASELNASARCGSIKAKSVSDADDDPSGLNQKKIRKSNQIKKIMNRLVCWNNDLMGSQAPQRTSFND